MNVTRQKGRIGGGETSGLSGSEVVGLGENGVLLQGLEDAPGLPRDTVPKKEKVEVEKMGRETKRRGWTVRTEGFERLYPVRGERGRERTETELFSVKVGLVTKGLYPLKWWWGGGSLMNR